MRNYVPIFTLSLILSMAGSTWAQSVPALDLSPVRYMPGSYTPIPISKTYFDYKPKPTPSESMAPHLEKIDPEPESSTPASPEPANDKPVLSQDGSITFPYGQNLPSIICAPLHVCEVSLQPGETIQQIDVGDSLRWQVKLARSLRDGIETSHLIIKPSEIGIVSNLVAITDKRTYSLQLISRKDRAWMPKVAFSYPDDMQANWQAYFAQNRSAGSSTLLASNTTQAAPTLDFKYRLKGDKPVWRPVRVYTDHAKTYIQLPAAARNEEVPVLLVLGPGSTEELVNYRLDGDQFVVDKVIQHAVLVSGVGKNQERVDIVKEGT